MATQIVIVIHTAKWSNATAPPTSVDGPSTSMRCHRKKLTTIAAIATTTVNHAYRPFGQRGVSAATTRSTIAPPSRTSSGLSAHQSTDGP